MNHRNSYNERLSSIIKDCLVIILIFSLFSFIDIKLAAFIAVITTVVLLTRRVIGDYNPGFVKGHHINYNDKEHGVPEGVDIFDLSRNPSMEHLYRYTTVVAGILRPSVVCIIRFCEKIRIEEFELKILDEAILYLQKNEIAVILSDVDEKMQEQLRLYGVETRVGKENIFATISDALSASQKIRN